MAILFWEGAEGYQSNEDLQAKINKRGAITSGASITSQPSVRAGAKGTRCIGISDNTTNVFYVTVNESTIYVEFWWATGTVSTNFNGFQVIDFQSSTGTSHFKMAFAVSGSNTVMNFYNANNTLINTITLYPANVWTHFAFKLVVGNTGNVTVKIDDVMFMNAVVDDFQNGAATTVGRVLFVVGCTGFQYFKYDDLVIQDSAGALLGSGVHSVALFPAAAGDTTQWTPSAGANYACVDELDPNDDTDYVASSTVAQLDLYNITDLPTYTGTVLGVDVWIRLRKDSGGTEQAKIALKTNSVVYYGSTLDPTNTYAPYQHMALVNPNTGVPWTQAEINALQIGMEVV